MGTKEKSHLVCKVAAPTLKTVLAYLKLALKLEFQSRARALFSYVGALAGMTISLVIMWLILSRYASSLGWSKAEMFVFIGTYQIIVNIFFSLFYRSFRQLSQEIDNGLLDFSLLKPINYQAAVSIKTSDFMNLLNLLIFGLPLVFWGLIKSGINVSLINALAFIFLSLLSVGILYGIFFALTILNFWFTGLRATPIFTLRMIDLLRFPTESYRGSGILFYLLLLPFTSTITLPAQVLLGKLNLNFLAIYIFLFLIVIGGSHWLWQKGLKRYVSVNA